MSSESYALLSAEFWMNQTTTEWLALFIVAICGTILTYLIVRRGVLPHLFLAPVDGNDSISTQDVVSAVDRRYVIAARILAVIVVAGITIFVFGQDVRAILGGRTY
jgi:hypothetical protein